MTLYFKNGVSRFATRVSRTTHYEMSSVTCGHRCRMTMTSREGTLVDNRHNLSRRKQMQKPSNVTILFKPCLRSPRMSDSDSKHRLIHAYDLLDLIFAVASHWVVALGERTSIVVEHADRPIAVLYHLRGRVAAM
eukprot:COSAG02_NODE_6891_length_3305_cov_2.754523_1_plen_135_part_00